MFRSTSILPREVDVIVAGGGTTGLLVASRLATADPTLSILVLESGIDTRDDPGIVNPALYLRNILPDSKRATFYKSDARTELADREVVVSTGGCLGGGSSINFMAYSRAQKRDFDDWETEGWSGEEMIPFLKKYERFQDMSPGIDKSVHGYDGEFCVSAGTYSQRPFQEDFFRACAEIGLPETADVQDLKTSNAVGKWNMFIDKNTGLRQDVPHRLLFPILDAGNTALQVVTEVRVSRILFDEEKRAIGVEYNPKEQQRRSVTVKARRLVILASGALGTPQVLERSGIGDEKILSELYIPLISDLPGVGANYQDHNVVFYPYESNASPEETLDGLVSGRLSLEEALKLKESAATAVNAAGKYILGWNGVDCVGKLRPSEADVETFPDNLKRIWERDFKPYPDRPLMLMSTLAFYPGDHSTLPAAAGQQYFCCGPYTPYPYSRGSIHITSKSVFDSAPRFNCGYFSDPIDLEKLVWGYKIQREIARRMAHYYRGPLPGGHPTFPGGSMADYDVVDEMSRKQGFPAVINYSEEDDNAIRTFIRQNVQTTWHSLGTCAMKPREAGGVVDKDLNVYGVKRLKVVDLSICPANVSANTYSTALAVGEKAASIIAKDLGIPYVV